MAVFHDVHFWPATGFPDRPWLPDPAADTFVKSARRVCELYSEGLRPARLEGPSAQFRLNTHRHHDDAAVRVEVFTEVREGWEMAGASLPDGLERLSADSRGLLVLDVIHGAVKRLASARGWEVSATEPAFEYVAEKQLVFEWRGPWKSSPNRKHETSACFRLEDDGHGRVKIEVRDRRVGDVIAVSDEELAFTTLQGFKRSAATLKWEGSNVARLIPYCGIFGEASGDLRVEVDGAATVRHVVNTRATLDLALPRPPVVVVGRGPDAPEQAHEILVIGGGPTNDVPQVYLAVLGELLEAFVRDGAQWWSASDLALLEIYYWFDVERPRIVLRRGNNRLRAFIHRPVQTLLETPDPAAVAVSDVQALLTGVASKMQLPPPPALARVPPGH